MPETPNAIVVLGMHRTGTSLTMAAVEALGVETGNHLLPPGPDNETGYWEDKSIIDLNERLLAVLGKTWYSVAPITESDWSMAEVDDLRREAAALLRNRFPDSKSWGFKDPRCLRLWPFWRRVLNEIGVPVKCVVTCRHPESVAASLAYRNQFAPARSYFLWLAHYVPFLDQLLTKPCIFIDYDNLIDQPGEVMDRLATFVHGTDELGQQQGQVNAFLERTLQRGLRHARFDTQEFAPEAPVVLREACALLDHLAKGGDAADAQRKAVILQQHYESYAMLLRQMDASQSEADRLGKVVREEEPVRDKIEKMGLYQADIGIKMERIDTRHAAQLEKMKLQQESLSDMRQVMQVMAERVGDVQEKVVVQLDEFYRSLKKELGHRESVRVEELARNLADARAQIDSMHRSTSWRFTKPLRAIKTVARRILGR